MKSLRMYAPLAAIVLGLNLLFVSCAPTANDTASISAKYSGEEIFRGLFFCQHGIADNIPQLSVAAAEINMLRANNKEVDQYLSSLATTTIDYINSHYPNFFDELQMAMYNGDYYQIQEKLNLSGKIIEQAILSSEEFAAMHSIGKEIIENAELTAKIRALDLTQEADQKQLEKILATIDGIKEMNAKARGVAIAFTTAVAVHTVVAVNQVLTVTQTFVNATAIMPYFVPCFSGGLQGDNSTLLHDELFVVEVSKFFQGGK